MPAPAAAGGIVLPQSVLEDGRARFSKAQAEAERVLMQAGGMACAHHLSQAQDDLIRTLYAALCPAETKPPLAILAVGGFGRGTLAPGSDTDLLFLLPDFKPGRAKAALSQAGLGKNTSSPKPVPPSASAAPEGDKNPGAAIAQTLLYGLWDLKLKLGHAARTIDESLQAARADVTIRTALLETRLIAGDETLYAEFLKRFEKEVVTGKTVPFVAAKLAEREARHTRAGRSRYLVEPNIKEGKGGLRDLQTLAWITQYVFRVKNLGDLVVQGVFTAREVALFRRCEEFLWRVRCHMHFVAGRAEERLNFDLQQVLAVRMAYSTRGPLSQVERFMRHYFLVAKEVGDLSAILSAELEARAQKPQAILSRMVGRLTHRRKKLADTHDFVLDSGRLTLASPEVLTRDPVNLIKLYWYADRDQIAIHPDAMRQVTLCLRHADESLRQNAQANRLFLDILTSPRAPEIVLRRMHEAGLLGRFIPDFARIQAMMQFSMYHHYTVDEHTLYCLGFLTQAERGGAENDYPLAHLLMGQIHNRRALYVALFLHDIGKGRPEAHEVVGARIARILCPRFGLSAQETETVAWLVENHLLLSQVAQSRDIGDPRTIASFAASVQSLERLRLLLILTFCDIRGVGPGVWNNWKGQLLSALYRETEMALSGEYSALERSERIAAAQRALAEQLADWDARSFSAYAQRHNAAYWIKVDLQNQVLHAKMLRAAEQSGERFAVEARTDAARGVTELTVMAIDHPRLLSILFGACAAAGANIVEAQIFTTLDGMALDTIAISRAFERDDDELRRAERVARHMVATLKGEAHLPDMIATRTIHDKRANAFSVAPEVLIDNELSAKATVVEVTGLDRPGLLYALTRAIGQQNLNIFSARILTYGEKAVDVFYLTDLTGGKITHAARQQKLRHALLEALLDVPDRPTERPVTGNA